MNVPNTYIMMMVFIDPSAWAFAKAAITRKKTRIGATAFNAPTNRLPRMVMPAMGEVPSMFGKMTPRIAPMIRNTRIRLIRLISFHLFHRAFKGNSFLLVRCASGPLLLRVATFF